jgi:sulfatase modifying factor 1
MTGFNNQSVGRAARAGILALWAALAALSCSKSPEDPGAEAMAQYMAAGFVRIEPGAFVLGSPETEAPGGCRGMYSEDQVEVTLTHPFEIAKTEVTQAQWKAAGFPNPVESNDEFAVILGDDLPVCLVDWYEALAFCNKLSEKAGLETCYDLSTCTGDAIGSGCPPPNPYATWINGACSPWEGADPYYCGYGVRRYESMYECPGYRLPTSSEWEYAARAGTTTATYNGELEHETTECLEDQTLEPIAWYCANAPSHQDRSVNQKVALKKPNAWGLYDILGNVMEWTDAIFTGGGLEEDEWYASGNTPPLIDPMGHEDNGELLERITRGGIMTLYGCTLRAAFVFGGSSTPKRDMVTGFRPVRTLFK